MPIFRAVTLTEASKYSTSLWRSNEGYLATLQLHPNYPTPIQLYALPIILVFLKLLVLVCRSNSSFLLQSKATSVNKYLISHFPFRALQFNYYNSNQRIHSVLLKSQSWSNSTALLRAENVKQLLLAIVCSLMMGPSRPIHVGDGVLLY